MTETSKHNRAPRSAAAGLAFALGAGTLASAGALTTAEQAQAAPAAETYTVQAGDGWWQASVATGIPMYALAAGNGMTIDTPLHAGMQLKAAAGEIADRELAEGTVGVRQGEGWYTVAARADMSMQRLAELNDMTLSDMLHPGMVLKTEAPAEAPAPVETEPVVDVEPAPVVEETPDPAPAPAPTPAPVETAPAPKPAPEPVRQSSGKQAAVNTAVSIANNPGSFYLWGGNGPAGFDCSGFTKNALSAAGISVPRTANSQYASSTKVPMSQAQPGDLLFWANGSGRVYHVAIYLGGGQMAHALNPSDGILITSTDYMPANMLGVAGRY